MCVCVCVRVGNLEFPKSVLDIVRGTSWRRLKVTRTRDEKDRSGLQEAAEV